MLICLGKDPFDQRKASKKVAEESKSLTVVTFDKAATDCPKRFDGGWKSQTHRDQWRNTLDQCVSPVLGNLDVGPSTPTTF